MTPTTHSTTPETKGAPRSLLKTFSRLEVRMLGLALVIAITLSILSPYFLKTANLLNLLDQSVVVGIVAIGMTFVILTGGIDLSVGSVVGLTGVILGLSLRHFPIPVSVFLAILSGAGIGLFSGFLIAYFDLAAFVITLGVMAIGRSLAYIFSGQTFDHRHSARNQRPRLYDGVRYPE